MPWFINSSSAALITWVSVGGRKRLRCNSLLTAAVGEVCRSAPLVWAIYNNFIAFGESRVLNFKRPFSVNRKDVLNTVNNVWIFNGAYDSGSRCDPCEMQNRLGLRGRVGVGTAVCSFGGGRTAERRFQWVGCDGPLHAMVMHGLLLQCANVRFALQ